MSRVHRPQLYLLTTVGCSLCEKAKQQLWAPLSEHQLTLQAVEIIDYPDLLAHFAAQIPVISLRDPVTLSQSPADSLAWPFTECEVRRWLSGHTS